MVQTQFSRKGRISQEERVEIYALLHQGVSLREIGRRLNRSHTSISRELDRNSVWCKKTWQMKYDPIKAEERKKI